MQKLFNVKQSSTTPVLFEIVSVFIYSLIEYLVKIAPCYFCFEHTTTLTVLKSYLNELFLVQLTKAYVQVFQKL